MIINSNYRDKNKVFSELVNEALNHLFIKLYYIQIQFNYYKILKLFRLNGKYSYPIRFVVEKTAAY